jgi:ABC-type nitrate/sulfonate/bicarbonate transport system substrate-binding protein
MSLMMAPGMASAADPFKVVAFAGSSNLPLWIGQTKGFFVSHGVDVVAYDEGQGEAGLGTVDFVALFGVDDGMLSLIVAPAIPSIKAIEGQSIAVDAATTGFAFVVRAIMAKNGVEHFDFVKVGGGAQRLQALLDGKQTITLLNTPLDIIAKAKGFKSLGRATDVIGPYQGIVAAVKKVRVKEDHAHLVAFTKGFHDSVAWLMDPANKAAAVGLLETRLKMAPAEADTAYTALTDRKHGIYRNMKINMRGLKTVMALRQKYAKPEHKLSAPARYVDGSILKAAMAK